MLPNDTRFKIENIVSGAIIETGSDSCTAVRNFLCGRFGTSRTDKKEFESKSIIKEEQAHLIAAYSDEHNLWYHHLPGDDWFLARGGEARVYLHPDKRHVVKVNDGIYYATWLEFLSSILIHNVIFDKTHYTLLGFVKEQDTLYAVLEQPFIITDGHAELTDIKKILEFNGFENTRRNDYYHKELGLILEDMHDENVVVNSETLFFIDSVFYITTPFNIIY